MSLLKRAMANALTAEQIEARRMEEARLAVEAEERRREGEAQTTRQATAQALANPQIGQMVAGKGVYAGIWQRGGKADKKYHVFVAPEDLTGRNSPKVLMTFKDAAREVASLKNWYGHDGGNFENQNVLYKALDNGSYKGEWFIPTKDLLKEALYKNKDAGDFAGTFTTEHSGSDGAHWYWSSTEHRDDPAYAWIVSFSDGDVDWDRKDTPRFSCRPVRVEELTL